MAGRGRLEPESSTTLATRRRSDNRAATSALAHTLRAHAMGYGLLSEDTLRRNAPIFGRGAKRPDAETSPSSLGNVREYVFFCLYGHRPLVAALTDLLVDPSKRHNFPIVPDVRILYRQRLRPLHRHYV